MKDEQPTQRVCKRVGLLLCLGMLFLAGGSNCTPSEDSPEPSWHVVLENLPGGLLSISGTSSSEVYAVGTDPGDGRGPLILSYNGAQWARLESGASGDLWWISDTAIGESFFMTGANGLILRYTPPGPASGSSRAAGGVSGAQRAPRQNGAGGFEQLATPGNETIYGVWGRAADNVWAVGGDDSDFEHGGVVWHFDGEAWQDVDLSALDPDGVPVLFKIWGRSDVELYAVGARGTVLLFDGENWSALDSPTVRTLFGVYGNGQAVVACGGAQSGVIIEDSGNGFSEVTPAGALQMNGTFVTRDGEAFTVGREGAFARRTTGAWSTSATGLNLDAVLHYHGPWSDPNGGIWAVGGNLDGEPVDRGLVVYYGIEAISSARE